MRTVACLFTGLVAGLALSGPARSLLRPTPAAPPVGAREPHRHLAFLRAGLGGPRDRRCVLLGDSLLDYWRLSPDLQAATFGADCLNLGVGSDRAGNALWRVTHGELDHVRAANVVVCLGANDLGPLGPDGTAEAVGRVVEAVRDRQPAARLILLGTPPGSDFAPAAAEANARLAALPGITYVPPDALTDPATRPDGLHPSPDGYRAWGESITTHLAR